MTHKYVISFACSTEVFVEGDKLPNEKKLREQQLNTLKNTLPKWFKLDERSLIFSSPLKVSEANTSKLDVKTIKLQEDNKS